VANMLDELCQRVVGAPLSIHLWNGPTAMEVCRAWVDDSGVWLGLRHVKPVQPHAKNLRLKVALKRVGSKFNAVQLVPPSTSNHELMSDVGDIFTKALRKWTEEVLINEK
jgi:hypothetical protein